jgi:prolyl-tRNA editing enzyme YbaK/EbsC (Cys-tRNA(Pro) deacylase)
VSRRGSGCCRTRPARRRRPRRRSAADLGLAKLGRATPEFVREHTGQAIGGVAPVHPGVGRQMRTLVDKALFQYDEVWAAGGIPHAVFPTSYDELIRITDGTALDVN